MQSSSDFNAAGLTRSLLRRSRQGALATLMAGTGDPYCSLVNVASDVDGAPILLISRLALHSKNILADDRVSLMLDERAAGDPLEVARKCPTPIIVRCCADAISAPIPPLKPL
jgi:putative heme iron utilization protein